MTRNLLEIHSIATLCDYSIISQHNRLTINISLEMMLLGRSSEKYKIVKALMTDSIRIFMSDFLSISSEYLSSSNCFRGSFAFIRWESGLRIRLLEALYRRARRNNPVTLRNNILHVCLVFQ
ncbi:unnamed protein product [Albugo candida]|uniref:Uncharacterized protein n=1 Tax=Albugo candida TaxID=65357 RepID=A0A024FV83_9STRA|nr:unnamed protein product [Albugo candida]|eukprot:CCI10951.1 unnamed protein product [Albugo candida]